MLLQLPVSLINGPQQLAERGGLLDRPYPVEGRAEQAQVMPGQKSDSYDAILSHSMTYN
jgi:hypothetical protein